MPITCQHKNITIIVIEAFDTVEIIDYKCTECGEIIKTTKQ